MSSQKLKETLSKQFNGNVSKKGYFDSYKQNIFEEEMKDDFRREFENGNGNELYAKAAAVHSSSMLCYNFLHWVNKDNPLKYKEVNYTEVHFEVKLKTLKGSSAPANLDALLIGKKDGKTHLLFIESKFLEYAEGGSKFELSKRYSYNENWIVDESGDLAKLITEAEHKPELAYGDGIKQAITHLFGIRGLKNDVKNNFSVFKKSYNIEASKISDCNVELLNLVFCPKPEYDEREKYDKYKADYNDIIIDKVPYVGWEDYRFVFNQIGNSGLKEFLQKRYMQFAQ